MRAKVTDEDLPQFASKPTESSRVALQVVLKERFGLVVKAEDKSFRVLILTAPIGEKRLKRSHVSVRDFQNQGNVVLLGGPWIDPWGQLFENRFNFRLVPEVSSPASSDIHNLAPAPGEYADYRPHMDGNLNVNYVRVAILPNLDKTGRVVLLSATSPESLEAAGKYLLSEALDATKELLERLHVASVSALPPLEVLLEARGLNAASGSYRLLAVRSVR